MGETYGNQSQPLLLSSQGDVIWSEDALRIKVSEDGLLVQSDGAGLRRGKSGGSLREAFLYARKTYFHGSARMPDELLFRCPQYNTWIELMYDQNQADILKYARGIRDNGFPAGVLMVDDNWQQNYGQWDFKQNKFPDAKAMIASLHADGFKVMLWICPFVHTNSEAYTRLAEAEPAIKGQVGCRRLDQMVERAKRVARFYQPRGCGLVLFTTGLSSVNLCGGWVQVRRWGQLILQGGHGRATGVPQYAFGALWAG